MSASQPLGGQGQEYLQSPLSYALRWRIGGVLPGAHAGMQSGPSGRFDQTVLFDRAPDPRRIDLRTTLRDPLGRLYVRQFQQRTAARVSILLDSSGSMRFAPERQSFALGRDLANAIVQAAHEVQDSIEVAVCADCVVWRFAARRGDPQAIRLSLSEIQAAGRSAQGLIEAARTLTGRRRFVLLISDFAFALEDLAKLLEALSKHDVVPVQVSHSAEKALPSWGVVELVELESGRRRMMLLRPGLRARWERENRDREARVMQLCLDHGRPLYALRDRFDSETFADYLLNP